MQPSKKWITKTNLNAIKKHKNSQTMAALRSPEFPCAWKNGTGSRENFAATKYNIFLKKRHGFVLWL